MPMYVTAYTKGKETGTYAGAKRKQKVNIRIRILDGN
jgi:hypothetical protein